MARPYDSVKFARAGEYWSSVEFYPAGEVGTAELDEAADEVLEESCLRHHHQYAWPGEDKVYKWVRVPYPHRNAAWVAELLIDISKEKDRIGDIKVCFPEVLMEKEDERQFCPGCGKFDPDRVVDLCFRCSSARAYRKVFVLQEKKNG